MDTDNDNKVDKVKMVRQTCTKILFNVDNMLVLVVMVLTIEQLNHL